MGIRDRCVTARSLNPRPSPPRSPRCGSSRRVPRSRRRTRRPRRCRRSRPPRRPRRSRCRSRSPRPSRPRPLPRSPRCLPLLVTRGPGGGHRRPRRRGPRSAGEGA
ncbi:hypothetical protein E4099_31000 [Streptomyces palmae]|uniref:Uncharacterized protein n=1 Tax=Streptomyces palmae TaxID=1701085 RepID=A0A4Z0FT37_9ACTN|nr:hypothetical protein E4099_31000 [Streptomyces palmae]